MHSLSSVKDFIVPGPEMDKLCFVSNIVAEGGIGGGGGPVGGGGGGAWAVTLLTNAKKTIANAAITTAVLEYMVFISYPCSKFTNRNV